MCSVRSVTDRTAINYMVSGSCHSCFVFPEFLIVSDFLAVTPVCPLSPASFSFCFFSSSVQFF